MTLKLDYNEQQITTQMPDNFDNLIKKIQILFNINLEQLSTMNLIYIDEDNEEIIISNDEDFNNFKETVENGEAINTIFCKMNNNINKTMDNNDILNIECLNIDKPNNDEELINSIILNEKEPDNEKLNELEKKEELIKKQMKEIKLDFNSNDIELENVNYINKIEEINLENDIENILEKKEKENNEKLRLFKEQNEKELEKSIIVEQMNIYKSKINEDYLKKLENEMNQKKNEIIEKSNIEKKLLEEQLNKIKLEKEEQIKELNKKKEELNLNKLEEEIKNLQKEKIKQINEQKKIEDENKKLKEAQIKLDKVNKLKLEEINKLKQNEIEAQKTQEESLIKLDEIKKSKEEILKEINLYEKEKRENAKKVMAEKKKVENERKKREKIKKQQKEKEENNRKKREEMEKKHIEREKKLIEATKTLSEKLNKQIETNEKNKNIFEEKSKKKEEDLKKKYEKNLINESKINIQEKIQEGIENYKKQNENCIGVNLNINELNEDQLQSNIDILNEQKSQFQNAVKEMKGEIIKEMNLKYSNILQQKIIEIHKSIYENIQKQNQTILENYIKKFNDKEEQRQLENSKLSQIIISDKNKIGKSVCKTVHKNIKCEHCFMEPIVGFRYKCATCSNYNLCEKCEEANEDSQNHPHDFIKIRNEERNNNANDEECVSDKKIELNALEEINLEKDEEEEKYSYNLITKELDFYVSNTAKNEEINLTLENNGDLTWPENETKLICNTDESLIGFNQVTLSSLKNGQQEEITIELNIPSNLPSNENKVYIDFNVKGENYGNKIILNVIITTEPEAFRKKYNLDKEDFNDQIIIDTIRKYENWNVAFEKLIDS